MIFLLDPGHGGIINGQYVTPGKRSPKWSDGTQLFEGDFNRSLCKEIMRIASISGIQTVDVVDSLQDVPLSTRVQDANKYGRKGVLYTSLHADAAQYPYIDKACTIRYNSKIHPKQAKYYYKEEEHPATGITVYTSKGLTTSDAYATILLDRFDKWVGNYTNIRKDTTDGDPDKEENFYVTSKTIMPAVLVEHGFMTNEKECRFLLDAKYREKLAMAHVEAMKIWEERS